MPDDVQVTWNGPAVKIAAAAGARRGVAMAAERVRAVSVSRTPMDVGDLRSSQLVSVDDDQPVAAVSTDLPYAVPQHENLHYRHRHGRAKFLESAALDSRDEVVRIVAEQTRRALGGT